MFLEIMTLLMCLMSTIGLGSIALKLTNMLEAQRLQSEANARCVNAKNEVDYRAAQQNIKTLQREMEAALDKEREAHNVTRDRLYGAVKEGFLVPPAPAPEVEPEPALPDALAPIWDDWDSSRGKEIQKNILRAAIANGRSVASLLEEYGLAPTK